MKGIIEELKELRTVDNVDKIDDICDRLDAVMECIKRAYEGDASLKNAREAGCAEAIYYIMTGIKLGGEKYDQRAMRDDDN